MKVITQPVNPRAAAREWIADTITKHLHPDLHPCGGPDRIREVAGAVEAEAFATNWPVETAVELAIEWCELRNHEAGLSYASHN